MDFLAQELMQSAGVGMLPWELAKGAGPPEATVMTEMTLLDLREQLGRSIQGTLLPKKMPEYHQNFLPADKLARWGDYWPKFSRHTTSTVLPNRRTEFYPLVV